jgi:hypothetical protein
MLEQQLHTPPLPRIVHLMIEHRAAALPLLSPQGLRDLYNKYARMPCTSTKARVLEEHGIHLTGPYAADIPARSEYIMTHSTLYYYKLEL